MPRYYVHLCRVVVENCRIEVEALDKDSAFTLAVDRAGDSDMTSWEWGDEKEAPYALEITEIERSDLIEEPPPAGFTVELGPNGLRVTPKETK